MVMANTVGDGQNLNYGLWHQREPCSEGNVDVANTSGGKSVTITIQKPQCPSP